MKRWMKDRPIVKSILLYLAVITAFFLLYISVGFYYEMNDDTSMMRIASGGFNGVPDGHLLFIRYAFGVMLATLFEMIPAIDWYGVVMLLLISVCIWLVIKRILEITSSMKKRAFIRVTSIICVISLVLSDVIFFQFTTVAGFIAATALFLIATENDVKISRIILYVVLLTVADMIRRKVFLMIIPFVLFVIGINILQIIRKGNDKRSVHEFVHVIKQHSKRILYYVCIIVFTMLSVAVVEKNNDNAYSSEEWSECKEYIHYRSRIVDYSEFPVYDGFEELWNSMEISREEHAILAGTFGILPDIDAEDLHKISELTDKTTISAQDMLDILVKDVLKGGYAHYKLCFLMVLGSALVLCFTKKYMLWEKYTIVGFVGISLAEMVYLLINGRILDRVAFVWTLATVASVGSMILRLCVGSEKAGNRKKSNNNDYGVLKPTLVILLCIVVFVSMDVTHDRFVDYQNKLGVYEEYKEYLRTYDEDSIFVVNTGTVTSRKQFRIFREESGKENILGTRGWSSPLPMLAEWKVEKGLIANQFPLCQEGVYYLTGDIDYILLMDDYMKSIGCTKECVLVDRLSLSNGKVINVVTWY